MSVKPPSKNHSFPPCPTDVGIQKNLHAPNSKTVLVRNRTNTTGEPRHCGAGGEATVLLPSPLAGHCPHPPQVPGNAILLGSWKKVGWFGSNLAGDQAPTNGDFLCPPALFPAVPGRGFPGSGALRHELRQHRGSLVSGTAETSSAISLVSRNPGEGGFSNGGPRRGRAGLCHFAREHLPRLMLRDFVLGERFPGQLHLQGCPELCDILS